MEISTTTRFDVRLPKEQKRYNERIIASQQDSEIFFDAILRQTKPNNALIEAVNEYNQILTK